MNARFRILQILNSCIMKHSQKTMQFIWLNLLLFQKIVQNVRQHAFISQNQAKSLSVCFYFANPIYTRILPVDDNEPEDLSLLSSVAPFSYFIAVVCRWWLNWWPKTGKPWFSWWCSCCRKSWSDIFDNRVIVFTLSLSVEHPKSFLVKVLLENFPLFLQMLL